MTADRLRAVPRWACECKRCGHKWESTGKNPPERCASCTSRYWQTEAGVLPRGRRPKAGTAVLELLIRDKARRTQIAPRPLYHCSGCGKEKLRDYCLLCGTFDNPATNEIVSPIRDKARKVNRAKTRRAK